MESRQEEPQSVVIDRWTGIGPEKVFAEADDLQRMSVPRLRRRRRSTYGYVLQEESEAGRGSSMVGSEPH
jgi:hypothetical protein